MPFGAAQVVPSLLGGHVDAVVQLPAALSAPVKQGQVRLLAALIPSRDPALPDVPTAREQGIDVSLEAWRGIAVPQGHAARGDRRAGKRDPDARSNRPNSRRAARTSACARRSSAPTSSAS